MLSTEKYKKIGASHFSIDCCCCKLTQIIQILTWFARVSYYLSQSQSYLSVSPMINFNQIIWIYSEILLKLRAFTPPVHITQSRKWISTVFLLHEKHILIRLAQCMMLASTSNFFVHAIFTLEGSTIVQVQILPLILQILLSLMCC